MVAEAGARVRELLKKLREEMRWLDVLRMLAAGGHSLLTRDGFEEQIKARAANASHDDGAPVDAEVLVRESLAKFTLPAWLVADLSLVEAWLLERAASDEAFEDRLPQRPAENADEFERAAVAAVARIVELMEELEPLCTAAKEPVGAFDFWQLHTWAGIILHGELATSERIGYAVGTRKEIAHVDRLARQKAAEWSDQLERLTEEVLAEGPRSDDELHAEINRRWADPAVRERLSRVARPWRPGSVVLMPPPDDG